MRAAVRTSYGPPDMPLVDRRYRLEETVEAYRYVERGGKIGNVIVSVEPPTSLGRLTDGAPS